MLIVMSSLVLVLLASHEPHRPWFEEQLASLAAQADVQVTVLHHADDGDPDAAAAFDIADLARRPAGLPTGLDLPHVYLRLVATAPDGYDAYCFADHDDIWSPDKLRIATAALSAAGEEPALWLCRVEAFTGPSARPERAFVWPRAVPSGSPSHTLVSGLAPGCAMVWNAALQRLIRQHVHHPGIVMHDWWLLAFASHIGRVIVEPAPLVRYRIHSAQAVGIDTTLRARLRRFAAHRRSSKRVGLESQAAALLHTGLLDVGSNEERVVRDLAEGRRGRLVGHWLRGRVRRDDWRDHLQLGARLLLASPGDRAQGADRRARAMSGTRHVAGEGVMRTPGGAAPVLLAASAMGKASFEDGSGFEDGAGGSITERLSP